MKAIAVEEVSLRSQIAILNAGTIENKGVTVLRSQIVTASAETSENKWVTNNLPQIATGSGAKVL